MNQDEEQLQGWALFSADADKVKEYVFESAKLPEIRGASMILDELNQARVPQLVERVGGQVSYAGGGSLLALIPYGAAATLKQDIEALYPRETGTATITCVWRQAADQDLEQRFRDLMARQSLELRKAKEEKERVPFFEAIPFARRCQSCGIRPAVEPPETEPEVRWLCWPCKKKAERSKQHGGKKQWTRDFVGELLAGNIDCSREAYLNGFEPTEQALDAVQGANDLSEIGQVAQDKRSIGFIYADGNGIGRLVEQSASIGEYQRKSEALHKAIRRAVFTGLACHLRIQRNVTRRTSHGQVLVHIHPFEIITVGGDDALLIVPGDRALDVAVTVGRAFETELGQHPEFAGHRTTVSVGLVVADCHNPVYFLHSLAEDLVKSAKKRDRRLAEAQQTPAEGTLDFIVLKSQSALSTDLSHLRARFPWTITSPAPRREKAILTGRPFTWTEVERLKRTAQVVARGLPLTQLQALRRALREGRLAGTLSYLYQWARTDEWRRRILRWVEMQWGMGASHNLPPFVPLEPRAGYARYYTVWEDIYEVCELVPELEDSAWENLKAQIQREVESEMAHAS
ncbi:MAG: hypothetical protein FJ026_08335 [Chloroflexi bacterium]|nr:hypothetical protein [Chloroflexota bacterium]